MTETELLISKFLFFRVERATHTCIGQWNIEFRVQTKQI